MKAIVNRVQLTGNLGAKPEVKIFDNGNKLARFSMATNEEYVSKKGEKAIETQWHLITAWGKLAEKIESQFEKGSFVSIEGKLVSRSYTDKQGHKKYITEVLASDAILNEKKED